MDRWNKVFYFYILIFIAAALFHLQQIVVIAYTNRHLLFIFINIFSALLCWKRPPIIFPLYIGILNIQQILSHGYDLIFIWNQEAKIDWNSVFVLIFLPILYLLAIKDTKFKKNIKRQ